MKDKFALTRLSCYVGIFVQAICCNITPILFIPMMDMYGFNYVDLGILVAVNFTAQVAVDIIFSGIIDKHGYRKIALPTIFLGFVGLMLFAFTPVLFKNNIFAGIIVATVIFAASSGLLEVMISPISNAIPTSGDKGASMSLMHSFYAWGQVATIIVTTLFIFFVGKEYWQIIVFIWAIIPLVNFFMFLKAPFPETVKEEERHGLKALIFKPFFILALLAIFLGGASEVTMSQWSSTFMEKALTLPKIVGDTLGFCGFAAMMGVGRLFYGIYGARINLNNFLITGASVTALCYIVVAVSPFTMVNVIACAICGLSASLLWPGTLVLSADKYPLAGAWMFAILAAAGDIGAACGPYLTGLIVDGTATGELAANFASMLNVTSEQAAIRIGVLCAAILPVLTIMCHVALKKMRHSEQSIVI